MFGGHIAWDWLWRLACWCLLLVVVLVCDSVGLCELVLGALMFMFCLAVYYCFGGCLRCVGFVVFVVLLGLVVCA